VPNKSACYFAWMTATDR